MILKAIHQTHESRDSGDLTTTVIAGITEYQYRDMTLRDFMDPEGYDGVPLRWLCDPGIGSDAVVRTITLIRGEQPAVTAVIHPGWAYMMSDGGDTIERI